MNVAELGFEERPGKPRSPRRWLRIYSQTNSDVPPTPPELNSVVDAGPVHTTQMINHAGGSVQ